MNNERIRVISDSISNLRRDVKCQHTLKKIDEMVLLFIGSIVNPKRVISIDVNKWNTGEFKDFYKLMKENK